MPKGSSGSNAGGVPLDDCDLNYKLASFSFLGTSHAGALFENQDVWITHCGFPAKEFNHAFLKRPGTRNAEAIEIAERFFGDLSLPFEFQCRSDLADRCEADLLAAGFEHDGATQVMTLDEIPNAPPKSLQDVRDFELTVVETADDLAAFQVAAAEGFGIPPAAGKLFLTPEFQQLPNVRLYLGKIDGEAVCTSALIATPNIAGIYWVSTLEAHRGRGLGAYLTAVAVSDGTAFGCRHANLQASEMGLPVYRALGFETPVTYVGYSRPEPSH